ncbi:TPA: translation initiation factor 1 (IF-1) [Streptococcus suis]|nr:translation initiation factor 1 (IF-1) [Streptococcus suis]
MKKNYILILVSILTLSTLFACSPNKNQASSSSSTSSTTSVSSSSSSGVTAPSRSAEVATILSMDIDSLMQGNYDSIIGTWQNSSGETLVFNIKGLVDESQNLLGRGKITDGIFETGYIDNNIGEVSLMMIPKDTTLSQSLYSAGSDPTDTTQDRILTKVGEAELDVDAFYRVSNPSSEGIDPLKNTETGIQLESGPKTIEYANSILGENNWRVIEGNYTRTETIPYNVLEGNDNTHYSVYQNGVIVNANYQIVYQP